MFYRVLLYFQGEVGFLFNIGFWHISEAAHLIPIIGWAASGHSELKLAKNASFPWLGGGGCQKCTPVPGQGRPGEHPSLFSGNDDFWENAGTS